LELGQGRRGYLGQHRTDKSQQQNQEERKYSSFIEVELEENSLLFFRGVPKEAGWLLKSGLAGRTAGSAGEVVVYRAGKTTSARGSTTPAARLRRGVQLRSLSFCFVLLPYTYPARALSTVSRWKWPVDLAV
jgi:hypothetical protein